MALQEFQGRSDHLDPMYAILERGSLLYLVLSCRGLKGLKEQLASQGLLDVQESEYVRFTRFNQISSDTLKHKL